MIVCQNCSHKYKGNFCPDCGQESHTHRINAGYFLHDIPHSVFHVDKGLLYTLRSLFTNPGKMLAEYMTGKRVRHFRPFAYVIIMSTICTLLIKWIEKATLNLSLKHNADSVIPGSESFFAKYISVLIFLLIPVLSLVTWLFYRKNRYNYWEHFLINTYLAAQLNIILLLIKLYGLLKVSIGHGSAGVNFIVFMVIFMCYYGYTFRYLMHPVASTASGILRIFVMNCFLACIYLTGFSITGIMEPWWNF
jgi:uncharacterized protein DUF3667